MEYFCKTHNKSCCVACISKIKGRGNGQHTDCDVCYIDEINDEKNKLNDNIKSLEDLSNSLNESINEWKRLFDKNENTKETLKINAQKIFTKLRNSLKEKEDNILLKIDKKLENDNNISKKSKKEKKNNSNNPKKELGVEFGMMMTMKMKMKKKMIFLKLQIMIIFQNNQKIIIVSELMKLPLNLNNCLKLI